MKIKNYSFLRGFCSRFPAQSFWLFMLLLCGCALSSTFVKINTISENNAELRKYKSYNWFQEVPVAKEQVSPKYPKVLDTRVKQAVESELNKRGFRKTEDNPEILIAYDVSVAEKGSPDNVYAPGFSNGYAFALGYRYNYDVSKISNYKPVDQFREGSLFIDVIRASDKQLIWRGWAENIILDLSMTYREIENYVDDILDKYPGARTKD